MSMREQETEQEIRGGRNYLSTFFDKVKTSVMIITFCACFYSAFLLNDLWREKFGGVEGEGWGAKIGLSASRINVRAGGK